MGEGEEESFKVVDRRGRTGDAGPAEPIVASSSSAAAPADTSGGSERGSLGAVDEAKPGLGDLFMMLAESALVSLGGADTSPEGPVDLTQARAAIDLLVMLSDKTQGNRTEEESQLLEQLVYDLQMRFVRAARGARPA
jgi:hypothetical protein